jgi:hypothetical protein
VRDDNQLMQRLIFPRRVTLSVVLPVFALLNLPTATPAQTARQHYGAIFSPDLVHWTDALTKIDFPDGMRHGSFVQITQAEFDRLAALAPPATASAARAGQL